MSAEKKKTNGHDPTAERIVAVLERIEGEIQGLRGEVRATSERLDVFKFETTRALTDINHQIADMGEDVACLRADVHDLRGEMKERREESKGTFAARLQRLEDVVFKRTG
jgi:hypothetical protein